jgi:hypothetical protein
MKEWIKMKLRSRQVKGRDVETRGKLTSRKEEEEAWRLRFKNIVWSK